MPCRLRKSLTRLCKRSRRGSRPTRWTRVERPWSRTATTSGVRCPVPRHTCLSLKSCKSCSRPRPDRLARSRALPALDRRCRQNRQDRLEIRHSLDPVLRRNVPRRSVCARGLLFVTKSWADDLRGPHKTGHTTALGYPNNPSEKAAQEKLARDGHVEVDDLVPGLALVLDFAENMNNIVQINREPPLLARLKQNSFRMRC